MSLFVCLFVCLSLSNFAPKRPKIPTHLHENFGEGWQWPMNEKLYFYGYPNLRLDTGIVFRIRHYWEIQKVVNGLLLVLIRQMAALIRRPLAEVCAVPVLLVT